MADPITRRLFLQYIGLGVAAAATLSVPAAALESPIVLPSAPALVPPPAPLTASGAWFIVDGTPMGEIARLLPMQAPRQRWIEWDNRDGTVSRRPSGLYEPTPVHVDLFMNPDHNQGLINLIFEGHKRQIRMFDFEFDGFISGINTRVDVTKHAMFEFTLQPSGPIRYAK